MTMKPEARDPGTIELTETQKNPYAARPEDFRVRRYSDPIAAPFHGQSANDSEAAKRSIEAKNTGSVRSQGNVDHA